MYLSTVLLLLLTSKLSYSAIPSEYRNQEEIQEESSEEQIRSEQLEVIQEKSEEQIRNERQEEMQTEPQEEELIVFTNPDYYEANEYMHLLLGNFKITKSGEMKLAIRSIVSLVTHKQSNNDCVIEKISSSHGYQLAPNGDTNCNLKCNKKNTKFVQFMNQYISLLIKYSFSTKHPTYLVQLYPIHSQTGDCINDPKKKTYKCYCKPQYVVTISRSLDREIRRSIVNRMMNKKALIKTEEKFIAFMLLLKFNPFIAPLFLAKLFSEFNVRPTREDLKFYYSVAMSLDIEAQNSNEVIDYKRDLMSTDYVLFQSIMKDVSTDTCRIHDLLPYTDQSNMLLSIFLCSSLVAGTVFFKEIQKFS